MQVDRWVCGVIAATAWHLALELNVEANTREERGTVLREARMVSLEFFLISLLHPALCTALSDSLSVLLCT